MKALNSPSIALVTPSFNQGGFLRAAIESVLNQKVPGLSYAVVDGGSSDDSPQIVEEFSGRLSWAVSEKDAGQYDAINKGFQRVEGEVMGWLNSDDMHCPWALSVVADIFAHNPEVSWLTTRFPLRWDVQGRATACSDARGYARAAFARGEYCCGTPGFFAAPIQQESTFWRRSLWNEAGGALSQDFGPAGDFELWCRFAKRAELYAVNVPLAGFRHHGAQQTVTVRDEYFRQSQRALDHHFPANVQPSWYRRLRPVARDRAPEFLRGSLLAAGMLHEAPVISRTRDNQGWRRDRVLV